MLAILALMIDPLQEIKREHAAYHPSPSYSYRQASESEGRSWSSQQWVLCNGRMELHRSDIERNGRRGGVITGRNGDCCFELMLTKAGWTLRDVVAYDAPKYAKQFGHDLVSRMLPWWGYYDAKALIELEPHEVKSSIAGDMVMLDIDTVSRGTGVKGKYIVNPRQHYRLERYTTTYTDTGKHRTRTAVRQFSPDKPLQLDAEDCTDVLHYDGHPSVTTKHSYHFTHNVPNGPELFTLAYYGINYQIEQPSNLPYVLMAFSGIAMLIMAAVRRK